MTHTAAFRHELDLVDATRLSRLTEDARIAPRRRSHLLLHAGPEDQVQRLLIAAQPGAYVRPHQHSQQWEFLILQRGCIDVLTFDEIGVVQGRIQLDTRTPVIQIAVATRHTCFVRTPDTVVIEVKPGPYRPNEFCDWAPEEGGLDAASYLSWLGSAQPGQKWKSI
jgi:cupin fold WbuC family metalloprotein